MSPLPYVMTAVVSLRVVDSKYRVSKLLLHTLIIYANLIGIAQS